MERRLDLESENKENKPEPVTMIEIKDHGKVDNEAFLRPKSRCDKSEPFLMPQQRPLHGGSRKIMNKMIKTEVKQNLERKQRCSNVLYLLYIKDM